MTLSDPVLAIIEQYRRLPLSDRKPLLTALGHVGVPESHGGFFVDPAKTAEEQRAIALFELDALLNAQSIGFAVEIIPLLYPFLERMSGRGRVLEALDVGPRTAAGTALMAALFMSHHSRVPTAFDTIDIDATFVEYQQSRWRWLRDSHVGDVFDVPGGTYDYVLCSHTLEHIADPVPFCRQLQQVARDFVFITCPYAEQNPIFGHHLVGDELIETLAPIHNQVLRSWWWERGDVIFFVLQGHGKSAPGAEQP